MDFGENLIGFWPKSYGIMIKILKDFNQKP